MPKKSKIALRNRSDIDIKVSTQMVEKEFKQSLEVYNDNYELHKRIKQKIQEYISNDIEIPEHLLKLYNIISNNLKSKPTLEYLKALKTLAGLINNDDTKILEETDNDLDSVLLDEPTE